MAALILAVALAGTPLGQAGISEATARWRPQIDLASRRFGVPADWIGRVMRIESGGMAMLGDAPLRSRAGAMGLMQLMPATWQDMRAAYALGDDPDDPRDNILAGTAYLRLLYDRFGYPGLFGAYNAGPARYGGYLLGRVPLPSETRAYLAAHAGPGDRVTTASRTMRPSIFALRGDGVDALAPVAPRPDKASLFAIAEAPR